MVRNFTLEIKTVFPLKQTNSVENHCIKLEAMYLLVHLYMYSHSKM